MFERIVVGTDGSGTASAAVKHAAELAAAGGGELVVVSAFAHPREGAPVFTNPEQAGAEAARGLLHDVEKHYADSVKVRTVLREGNAADAIIDVAEEEGADLIVVGNRGMTGAKRALLGSVPNTVSHHAPCHVLIVHTSEG
jgi:nucleotide-binding universal stress UspA family protein